MNNEENALRMLVLRVKQKKELRGIADDVVLKTLTKFVKAEKTYSEADNKLIVKQARAELRKLAGRFQENIDSDSNYEEIIEQHSSTKERREIYPLLIERIREIGPKKIIDLGSGVNPLVLANEPSEKYYAYDINQEIINLLNRFFRDRNVNGAAEVFDLRDIEKTKKKFEADLCLIFKVFDVLESKGHKLAEKIISVVDASHFIISFPTKTLSGKPMNHPQRGWIERLLTRKGFSFEILKAKNEIFYFAKKNK